MWLRDVLARLFARPLPDTPELREARDQVDRMRERRKAILEKRRRDSDDRGPS